MPNSVSQDERAARYAVIERTTQLLTDIHNGYAAPVDPETVPTSTSDDPALEDAKRQRALNALLDLLSLEGIYPSLSSGVGIPLEKRVLSSLPTGVIAKTVPEAASDAPRDEVLLNRILTSLLAIWYDQHEGIRPMIRNRLLSDVISALSDLAYNSRSLSEAERVKYRTTLDKIIQE